MAKVLNDVEIRRLMGEVIVDGDVSSVRPNSYILRLGSDGEFLNTGKSFELGRKKKGIKIQPGHAVGVTAMETIDFRRKTVQQIYPGSDLHGLLSPTTDLSREGIVASTTQVDAGYRGTLNWTLTNTSRDERRFVYGERLYRLTILLLEEGETPGDVYEGHYQERTGYVPSERTGAPVGMKETEWEDASVSGGPENLLDDLIKSGYPWHLLGSRLKEIDQQFKTVTQEYSEIHDAIGGVTKQIQEIRSAQGDTSDIVRRVLRQEAGALQNRSLISVGSVGAGIVGLLLATSSNEAAVGLLREYGGLIGLGLILASAMTLLWLSRRN